MGVLDVEPEHLRAQACGQPLPVHEPGQRWSRPGLPAPEWFVSRQYQHHRPQACSETRGVLTAGGGGEDSRRAEQSKERRSRHEFILKVV